MPTPDTRGVLLQKAGGYPHIAHLCMIAHRQRVLYIGQNVNAVREVLDGIKALDLDGVQVRLTRGAEEVRFPEGGIIHFGTARNLNARGRTLDHIVLDTHCFLDEPSFRREVEPCFNGVSLDERYTVFG